MVFAAQNSKRNLLDLTLIMSITEPSSAGIILVTSMQPCDSSISTCAFAQLHVAELLVYEQQPIMALVSV